MSLSVFIKQCVMVTCLSKLPDEKNVVRSRTNKDGDVTVKPSYDLTWLVGSYRFYRMCDSRFVQFMYRHRLI